MTIQRFQRTMQCLVIAATIAAAMAIRLGADLAAGLAAVHAGWVTSLAGAVADRLVSSSGTTYAAARSLSAVMASMGEFRPYPDARVGSKMHGRPEPGGPGVTQGFADAGLRDPIQCAQRPDAERPRHLWHDGPDPFSPEHDASRGENLVTHVVMLTCLPDSPRVLRVRIRHADPGESTMSHEPGQVPRAQRAWRAIGREHLST